MNKNTVTVGYKFTDIGTKAKGLPDPKNRKT
jgi:hypothetical protein